MSVCPSYASARPPLDGFPFNPLNAKLNPICHLLALLGAHHIFYISGLRVKVYWENPDLVKIGQKYRELDMKT
jgi:hypothetical protein